MWRHECPGTVRRGFPCVPCVWRIADGAAFVRRARSNESLPRNRTPCMQAAPATHTNPQRLNTGMPHNPRSPQSRSNVQRSGNTWAIVLAAGEGSRLHSLTTTEAGIAIPKQYCSLRGGPSLLREALQRAEIVAHRASTAILYRLTAGNPLPGNERIMASERLGGRSRLAAAAEDSGAFSFSHRASSCLRRSMNQRPAGPGGLSVRYTADIAMT